MTRAALVQITASDDPEANLPITRDLVRRAASEGADLIATPEVTNCVSASRARQREVLRREAEDPTLAALREEAAARRVWLVIGSLALRTDDPDGRFVNRSFLIGSDGGVVARYDKIHMFDVAVSATETYRESAGYRPGDRAVVADTPLGRIGLTVCYDLRFPALYRRLAQDGGRDPGGAVGLLAGHGRGALGAAAEGARDRDRGLGAGARAVRNACGFGGEDAADPRPFPRRGPMGRGGGRRGRGARGDVRRDRPRGGD